MTWPNFFIVGATRSGTTSFYEYLQQTSGIFMSAIKEPSFFAPSINRRQPIQNKENYLELFSKAKSDQPIGEASTRYLIDPKSAELIKNTIPNAKIIILLRNPIDRAFSSYLYYLRRENWESFDIILDKSIKSTLNSDYLLHLIVHGGLYYEQVKRYIDIFGYNSVKILFYEEFIANIEKSFKEVLEFLEIDSEIPEIIYTVFNEYKKPKDKISKFILSLDDFIWKLGLKAMIPVFPERKNLEQKFLSTSKKPKISESDQLRLRNFYKEDVTKLQKLLKQDTPWNSFN
jgi:hypothetical protein